jgi:hypothetical protein
VGVQVLVGHVQDGLVAVAVQGLAVHPALAAVLREPVGPLQGQNLVLFPVPPAHTQTSSDR